MRQFPPVSAEDLTDAEQALTEDLLDYYELLGLDTRERDLARNAIYQVIHLIHAKRIIDLLPETLGALKQIAQPDTDGLPMLTPGAMQSIAAAAVRKLEKIS